MASTSGVSSISTSRRPPPTWPQREAESATRAASAAYEMVVVPVWSAGEYPWVDSWRTKPTAAGAAGCSGRVVVMAKVRLTSPSPVVESGFHPEERPIHSVDTRSSPRITFGRVSPVMPMYAATAALIIE